MPPRVGRARVIPGPRPSDAELRGTLGIELDLVGAAAEQAFDIQGLGWAIRKATHVRRCGIGRVAHPLQSPPTLAAHALMLARERASALGSQAVSSEPLLLECWTTSPHAMMAACTAWGGG
jgi:hypothetical protein